MLNRRDAALTVALAVAGAGFGIGAELAAGAPQGVGIALLDFVVGMLLLGFGAAVHLRRPESLIGVWTALTGLAWFAGTLGWPLVYLHRGFLALLILGYPGGRLRRNSLAAAVVAVAMVDSTVVPLARDDRLTVTLAIMIVIAALYSFIRSVGIARRAAAPRVVAAFAFASALSLAAGLRLAGVEAQRSVLWAYDLAVVGLAMVLIVDLLRARWSDAVLRGLIADLSSFRSSPTLRERLARALGDPTLIVGLWDGERRTYLDESGAPVELPAEDSSRVGTRIEDGRAPLALLVHENVLSASELVPQVAAVTRTAVANASLELEVERRIREIDASRRRLVEAADGERRALQQTLARGPEKRLQRVSHLLATRAVANTQPEPPSLQDFVEAAIAELQALADGVRPAELSDGLRAALPALAARSPLDVSVHVTPERLPDPVEAAAYFVCSEALANAAKHSGASSAHVEAVVDSHRVYLTVSDRGVGGADATSAGLRGLTDRVEALGGRLRVESPPGAGTRVLAEMPCNSH